MLDLVQSCFVQVEVLPQGSHVAWLLSDNLGGRILDDPGAMNSGVQFGADEILRRLAHTPDARISLTRGSKQLNCLWGEDGRVEQEPALVENRNAATAGLA